MPGISQDRKKSKGCCPEDGVERGGGGGGEDGGGEGEGEGVGITAEGEDIHVNSCLKVFDVNFIESFSISRKES